MSAPIDLRKKQLAVETSDAAVHSSQLLHLHVTDLQVTTNENGDKIISLRSYAKIPFFGRIISYIRSCLCDSKGIIKDLNEIPKKHHEEIDRLVDQIMDGKITETDDIKSVQIYCEKLSKYKLNFEKYADLKEITSFDSRLRERITKLFNPKQLDALEKDTKAGKLVDQATLGKLQKLDDVTYKIYQITNVSFVNCLFILQQTDLAKADNQLKDISFLAKSPNKLAELCRKASAQDEMIESLSPEELQKLLTAVVAIRKDDGFQMYLSILTFVENSQRTCIDILRDLEVSLKALVHEKELAPQMENLEFLKSERLKVKALAMGIRETLNATPTKVWKTPLSRTDFDALFDIVNKLKEKGIIDDYLAERFFKAYDYERHNDPIYCRLYLFKGSLENLLTQEPVSKNPELEQRVKYFLQCIPKPSFFATKEDADQYIKKQRSLLKVFLEPQPPEVLSNLHLNDNVDEVSKFTLKMHVFEYILKRDLKDFNWDKLPGDYTPKSLVEDLGNSNQALELLSLLPVDNKYKDAFVAFFTINSKSNIEDIVDIPRTAINDRVVVHAIQLGLHADYPQLLKLIPGIKDDVQRQQAETAVQGK